MSDVDPFGWGAIRDQQNRWAWWAEVDRQNGLPAGTTAAANGEPIEGWTPPAEGTPARPSSAATPTSTPAASGAAATGPDMGVYKMIADRLAAYGLGKLLAVNPDGTPTGWLWDQLVKGIDTDEEIKIAIEATPEWQKRFAPIVRQRERAARGEGVQIMTPDELVAYEAQMQAVLRRALPNSSWMWDNVEDFWQYADQGRSVAEIADVLGQAFERVNSTPPAVRDAFDRFYGVGNGEAALASFFLDPDKTAAALERSSRAAYTAGTATRYGMTLGKDAAEWIADKPISDAGIDQGLEAVNRMAGLFREGVTEGQDLTAEGEGIGAVFSGDAMAQQSLDRRLAERKAGDRGGAGGALVTNRGVTGVASGRG